MRLPRLSIAGLMAIVGLIALGVAALSSPSPLWVNVWYSLALAVLAAAVLGAVFRRGARRAFWVGFAAFGWGYFLMSLGPHADSLGGPYLVTTAVLDLLYAEIAPPEPAPAAATPPGQPRAHLGGSGLAPMRAQRTIIWAGGFGGMAAGSPPARPWSVWTEPDRNSGSGVASNYISLMSPDHFRWIGHSIFTLLVGWLGGRLGRYFYTTREPE